MPGAEGNTVNLSIRNAELVWCGAQETIPQATCSSKTICTAAMKIFGKIWKLPAPVHSIRVAVSNLGHGYAQDSFFEHADKGQDDKLSNAFDTIRKKHGTTSVMFGTGASGEFTLEFEVIDT